MENFIYKILKKELKNDCTKIFLCVGTNNCVGDSLGPIVGDILTQKINSNNIYIVGNSNKNLNSKNFNQNIEKIKNEIYNPFFIIIDSALANKEVIGKVIINNNSMIIGSALNKKHELIGNLCIKGVVGENKENSVENFFYLNSVPKAMVENLSYKIANSILKALEV